MAGGRLWSVEEDEILRNTTDLTAHELTDLLPGRTTRAIDVRRRKIGVRPESSSSSHSPNQVGSRTLLAKTCTGCGLLLDATWFTWREACRGHPGHWRPLCRKCGKGRGVETPESRERRRERYRTGKASPQRLQALTVDRAHRFGQPWTEADERILDDPELTLLEKALKCGRTYYAVSDYCRKRGYTSKVGLGDAVAGQWRIFPPNEEESAA